METASLLQARETTAGFMRTNIKSSPHIPTFSYRMVLVNVSQTMECTRKTTMLNPNRIGTVPNTN